MITKIISWLSAHKGVNIVLVLLYTCVILFLHNTFVECSIAVMNHLGLESYNFWVKVISITTLLTILLILLYKLYFNAYKRCAKLLFLLVTISFILLHASIMFEMNIEIIHSFEFSILAFLLFPFSNRVGAAVIMTLPFMFLDEFNQYIFLYPNYNKYFELNDILMDTLGSGFLLIILSVAGVVVKKSRKTLFRLPEFLLLCGIMLLFLTALGTGLFAMNDKHIDSHSILSLNKLADPDSFWQIHSFTKATYHVMNPIEGLVIITAMCLFFIGYDRAVGK